MRAVLLLAFAALTCASLACRDRDTGTPTPTAALPAATAPDATATTSPGTTPTASPSPTSTAPAGVLDPGTHEHTLESGGRGRRYLVHVPPGPPGSLPVVMVLHGGGGNANQVIRSTRFDEVADENGFIAVFPHGSGRLSDEFLLTWNSGNCCGYARAQDIDDVAFLRAVVEAVLRDYGADARRVYVTGMSNGGMMSYRLACEASGVFAAAAPVAGALNVDCNPGQPVSLLAIHGTGDRMVRYEGGEPLEQVDPASRIDTSVADSVGFFVAHNACAEPPATTMDGILRYDEWGSCDQNARVALYTIEGGVHEWPGDRVATVGREIDASRLIWQFFAALPLVDAPLHACHSGRVEYRPTMATYVLMLTLNGDGRQSMLADPDSLLRAQNTIEIPGVSCLGLYGVLGRFDFVTILEAPDNDAAARFSLELGVRAGAHIETLPAVPIGHFHAHHFETFEWAEEPGDGDMTGSAG